MCGIVYCHNFDGSPVNNNLLNIFDAQRSRGLQGFGLFDGQESNIVRETKEDGILKWLCKYDSNMILFHHRFPTSTDNVRKAAHPFATKDQFGDTQYILVHNGHISNSKELREVHEKQGIKYQSTTDDGRFNDSEALLWDFALTMEKKQKELAVKGGIAFICMKLKKGKPHTLFFGRNTNPLNMKVTDTGVQLSSQGEGDSIDVDHLYAFNYKTRKLTKKEFEIPQYSYSSDNSNWNWQNKQYHAPPKAGTAGDWLPDETRKKFAKYLPESDPNFIDYDRDGNPIYLTDYDSYDDYYVNRYTRASRKLLDAGLSDEQLEDMELIDGDEAEAYQLAFEYMDAANGCFEEAYYMAEGDYQDLFDVPDDEQDEEYLRQIRTMELVMSEINSDPEYLNEKSVSSTWNPLTQQMLKV